MPHKSSPTSNLSNFHIVDATDIAHHLKFENFNAPIPTSITDLFTNLMHNITLIFLGIFILYFCYKLYMMNHKKIYRGGQIFTVLTHSLYLLT